MTLKKTSLMLSILLSLALPSTMVAAAEDAASKGLAIAKEADQRDQGWKDSTASMHMVLINAKGQKTDRELRLQSLEGINDGDKCLTVFD